MGILILLERGSLGEREGGEIVWCTMRTIKEGAIVEGLDGTMGEAHIAQNLLLELVSKFLVRKAGCLALVNSFARVGDLPRRPLVIS